MIQIPDAPYIRAAQRDGYIPFNYTEEFEEETEHEEISEFIPALRLG